MTLNWGKKHPDARARRWKIAREHLEFCAKLYKLQIEGGRYFTHEHPSFAASWHEDIMQDLGRKLGVIVTHADQCAYGLVTRGPHGMAPAQKPTKFMTNSPCVATELGRRCPNRMTHSSKRHQHV